jgi:hypothetical protein
MSGVIDNEERVLRIVLRDHVRNLYGEGELGVIGRNGKDFRLIVVAFPKALLQIVQLRHDPEIVGLPV